MIPSMKVCFGDVFRNEFMQSGLTTSELRGV